VHVGPSGLNGILVQSVVYYFIARSDSSRFVLPIFVHVLSSLFAVFCIQNCLGISVSRMFMHDQDGLCDEILQIASDGTF